MLWKQSIILSEHSLVMELVALRKKIVELRGKLIEEEVRKHQAWEIRQEI